MSAFERTLKQDLLSYRIVNYKRYANSVLTNLTLALTLTRGADVLREGQVSDLETWLRLVSAGSRWFFRPRLRYSIYIGAYGRA